MTDTEAMLAALIESAKTLGGHAQLRESSDETIAYWERRTKELAALLQAKVEESAEILPCKHARPPGGSVWCHICGAWTEPVDAPKHEDGLPKPPTPGGKYNEATREYEFTIEQTLAYGEQMLAYGQRRTVAPEPPR